MLEMMKEGDNSSCASTIKKKKNDNEELLLLLSEKSCSSSSSLSERHHDLASLRRWDVLFINWSVLPAFLALLHPSIRPFWRIYMFLVIVPTWVITFHRDQKHHHHHQQQPHNSTNSTWRARTTQATTWALRLMGMFGIVSVLSCGCYSVVATTTGLLPLASMMSMIGKMIMRQQFLMMYLFLPLGLLQNWMIFETFHRCLVNGQHFVITNPAVKAMARSTFVVSLFLCAISTKFMYFCIFASASSSLSSMSSALTRGENEGSAPSTFASIATSAASAMSVPLFYFVTACAVFAYAAWILSQATGTAAAPPTAVVPATEAATTGGRNDGCCSQDNKSRVDDAEAIADKDDDDEPMVKEEANCEHDNNNNGGNNNNTSNNHCCNNTTTAATTTTTTTPIDGNNNQAYAAIRTAGLAFMYGMPLVYHAFPIYYGLFQVHFPTQQVAAKSNNSTSNNNNNNNANDLSLQLFILSITLFGLATMFQKMFFRVIGYRVVVPPTNNDDDNNNSSNNNNSNNDGGGGGSVLVQTMSKTYVHDTSDIVGVSMLEQPQQPPDVAFNTQVSMHNNETTTSSSPLLLYDYCTHMVLPRVVVEMKEGITLHLTPRNPTEFIQLIENAMGNNNNYDVEQPRPSLSTTSTMEKETDGLNAVGTERVVVVDVETAKLLS